CSKKRALVIGVPVEKVSTMSELIVHASECIGLTERGSKASRKGLERRPTGTGANWSPLMRSLSRKKNSLFLMIGPPNRPPNCDRWNGELKPGGLGKLAATELSRNKPNAWPWRSLLPERVVMLTAPEEVSSLERSRVDWLS